MPGRKELGQKDLLSVLHQEELGKGERKQGLVQQPFNFDLDFLNNNGMKLHCIINFYIFIYFYFLKTGFQYSFGPPGIHSADQTGLQLKKTLPPLSPKCWG